MSNFSAEIQAKLNTSGIDSEIKTIENNKINFKNISLDTTKLVSDIQAALNKNRFTINLDKVNMSSVTSQMQKSGAAAGKSFSASFNSSLSSINTTTNNATNTIQHMQRTLASMKFDRSSIDLVTKDLQSMSLAISNVTTRINGNNLNLSIRGIDELGRAVTIVKQFDYESGRISAVGKTISQSFDTGAAAAKRFEESAKKATTALSSGSVEASIAKVTAQYEKLGTTGHAKLAEIKADIQQLSTLQTAMNNSKDTSSLVSNYEKFNETLAKVKSNLSVVSAESKTFVSGLQISTLDNKIASWMEKNSKASRDFGASIDNLRGRLASLNASGAATASELNAIEREFDEVRQAAIATGQVGSSVGNRLKGAFSSILSYVSVSTVIYQSINALKEMYQNVYNIDTEMIELKKVTDETATSYSNFLKGAGSTAKEIGTTISDLVSSTADFAKLGYSFSDSQELAKVANIYSVVGDEIDSIDTATKSIISTLTAFHIEANDAMSIVDKFNEIGNNYAISSGGIGDALERSASSMAAANNTLDETIALITAANTVVQDPDSIGTAFKTISMRIRGAKTEMEEAGLETDGMAKSVSELRDEIKALSGVDIMVDDDTFKSTYDILDELSQKWEDLTDIQQASITELIAGKRQGNIVSSLMTNFDIARDTLKTSLNSEGSATEELGKWMEGFEAKSKQFRAAFESLSLTFLDSSFFKGLIDAGTGVLKILTAIIDNVGVLPTLIGTISAALSFKNVGKDKMFSFFLS
ncbi:MAG: phage tail tape measure protein [Erysipelotrichaceae bacterium]|nr:phage tail tape measure protein [Erysipelotrichaceae bacterium]